MNAWPATWPRSDTGASAVTGVLRTACEDFEVAESLGFVPTGAGEHLYVHVAKRGVTTAEVQRRLAAASGVPRADVSYAGMKDRYAVARQWFSVRCPRREVESLGEEVRILCVQRHARKLRRGELRSNRFRIRIRGLSGDAEAHLERVRRHGAPNYFGAQRFGTDGGNVAAARRWIRDGRPRVPRFTRSLYLSSLRSFLFNELLGRRVADGTWGTALDGEALLEGVPSGPLWGRGRPQSTDAALALESSVVAAYPDISDALEHVGLRSERRALAVVPSDLSWSAEGDTLTVEFTLGKGAYATSVLREVGDFPAALPPARAGGQGGPGADRRDP